MLTLAQIIYLVSKMGECFSFVIHVFPPRVEAVMLNFICFFFKLKCSLQAFKMYLLPAAAFVCVQCCGHEKGSGHVRMEDAFTEEQAGSSEQPCSFL